MEPKKYENIRTCFSAKLLEPGFFENYIRQFFVCFFVLAWKNRKLLMNFCRLRLFHNQISTFLKRCWGKLKYWIFAKVFESNGTCMTHTGASGVLPRFKQISSPKIVNFLLIIFTFLPPSTPWPGSMFPTGRPTQDHVAQRRPFFGTRFLWRAMGSFVGRMRASILVHLYMDKW